ncbi:hypothetical protein KY285_032164 [Solanum tuberosum]|nr:hypothetical protein KY284_031908 [Solanum tuberosum]KAH0657282.1 hypothetical protein KY285_032164 [Solanum tuberosum]
MGFFSPGDSENRYVGIWYKNISVRTVVWVANREAPLTGASSILKVIEPGILVLVNGTNSVVWSTNTSRSVQNSVAQLLDSGNLVVKQADDDNPGNFLWQSFDHPSDTLLPGMKLGWNFITGREVYLSSWKNEEDPAPGDYTYHCDPSGYPQNILKKGSDVVYRSGPWNGLHFSGAISSRDSPLYTFGIFSSKTDVYFGFYLTSSVITRLTLSQNGALQRWIWGDRAQDWIPYLSIPTDNCDVYKLCGAYGSCNSQNSPVCGCLDKFVPKHDEDWQKADWSSGCVRRIELNCLQGDIFLKYSHMKLPDTRNSWSNVTMTLEECKTICSRNCSCMAYSNIDIRNGGSGCLLWFKDLLDIRQLSKEGQDIYIRIAASELDSLEKSDGKKRRVLFWILPLSVGLILVILSMLIFHRRRKKASQLKKKGRSGCNGNYKMDHSGYCDEEFEIPMFDLSTIMKATNNFSIDRKIGEGGFGPVYKGILERREIAVKRLSRTSTQGEGEFKNEVIYVARLQHRNLVKILGCCSDGEEKMLIYEYLTNGSLDSFIFDDTQSKVLDWPKRFHIINGIARGLMYLHQDSQLRIIHRDLKANNILLDKDMNPKISDFGLAKICEEDDVGAMTNRVVGTYGYLSPEYALHGKYSVKSDVFSFGILVLEIVSGKSNRKFCHPDHNLNLLGHAWKLYKEGRSLELLDERLGDSCSTSEVVRSISVVLLCVQQCPEDRLSMSSVVLMLNNEGVLPLAKQPGFYIEGNAPGGDFAPTQSAQQITVIEPGILVLLNDSSNVVWSTNTSRSVQNPVAELLDSGNLVVKQSGHGVSDGNLLWQSFDHPTNTLLAGMKLGWNFVTGREVYLSSWKNEVDPAPGDYTYHCDPSGYPQNIMKKGSDAVYRSGPWNGRSFSGSQNSRECPYYTIGVFTSKTELYFGYKLTSSVIVRLILSQNGVLQLWTWGDGKQGWVPFLLIPADNCDTYKLCGAYGSCNSQEFPVCGCLDKFVPNNTEAWKKTDWSGGCVRRTELNCLKGDVFLKYSHIKLPDTRNSWSNVTMTLEECKDFCSKNCSCMAYSNADIRNGGSGCILWLEDLLDIQQESNGGQDIYIRMAASEADSLEKSNGTKRKLVLHWILPFAVGAVLVILSMLIYHRRKKTLVLKKKGSSGLNGSSKMDYSGSCAEKLEIPLFDLSTIMKATNNFSIDRKIGEGGFGPVYKGILEGQEIAVKRLSRTSTQGENEFMNEVVYIAKLQHRNLVKILGCCIEGEEKMLMYEYLPNGSLDSFIFDETQTKVLDWPKRFHIINGIARGLMYLHQDSQLRIIHRDLKANNILLDKDMNPKISDFGLAKICEEDDVGAMTNRVVGTHGYLSPEYALYGKYSVKSDVFSFGILVLEIVSGKSNRKSCHPDYNLNLLGHAWNLYKEGRSTELLDECLGDSCSTYEVVRSIGVGLLCVQQCPEDRPNMSSAVLMLNNEGVLPLAKLPGFYIEGNAPSSGAFSSSQYAESTVTETPITILNAR